jgi:hypothetical protein
VISTEIAANMILRDVGRDPVSIGTLRQEFFVWIMAVHPTWVIGPGFMKKVRKMRDERIESGEIKVDATSSDF